MDRAYFYDTKRIVTPSQFVEQAGQDYKERNIVPICPSCGQYLIVRGVNSPTATECFVHHKRDEHADPLDDCIYIERNDSPFKGLEPSGWDYEHGNELKKEFFTPEFIALTYSFMLSLCRKGNLTVKEFTKCIDRANNKNIWNYKDIPLWVIPYILLTLYSPPDEDEKTRYSFRLKKPQQTNASGLWMKSKKCELIKVFTNSGAPVKVADNPFEVSKDAFMAKAKEMSSWVKDNPHIVVTPILHKFQ